MGVNTIEREGVSYSHPAEFILFDFIAGYKNSQDRLCRKIIHARQRLPHVKISKEMMQLCSKFALDAFVAGHRADIFMRKVAIAIASFEKRETVNEKGINEAANLVLFHRVRKPPSPFQHQKEDKKEESKSPPEKNKKEEKGDKKSKTRNQQGDLGKKEKKGR